MEPIAECQIDLFADKLPSADEIEKLSAFVHSSEASLLAFRAQVEENMSKTGQKTLLPTGIGLFILGRDAEAIQKLSQSRILRQ